MSLKDTINEKWKEAFKARDLEKRTAYELVKQRIMVAEKSGQFKLPLTDEQITTFIAKECKERSELLSIYKPEDEQYIFAKYIIEELSQYLPKQMTAEEVKAIITKLYLTEQNKGKLIGLTVKEIGTKFDKSKIAGLVNEVIGG